MVDAVVVGQVARDLVLVVEDVPPAGGTTPVRARRELLGGKGANIAVALAQLGTPVAVVGVVGDDDVADRLLAQARADRVDVSRVVRRPNQATGLIVDIVDGTGHWRYLEDLPDGVLLTEADVARADGLLRSAAVTVVQLQQPPAAALAAARCARQANRMVVLDGAPAAGEHRQSILDLADVVRADATEAALLAGRELRGPEESAAAARELLRRHRLSLVAFAVAGAGNVFVWDGGDELIPLVETEVVDTTGSGDAFTAALTSALCRGYEPHTAGRFAVAAAAATVGHPGGRPSLTPNGLRAYLSRVDT
jgi:ribokinase